MSRRWASASRERMAARPSGDAEDLNAKRSSTRTVELGHQDSLPLAQHDFAAAHLQRQAMAEQKRSKMRVGVHPIAIRVFGVVVHPGGIPGDHLLEKPADIGQQRGLKLVDEQRARRCASTTG